MNQTKPQPWMHAGRMIQSQPSSMPRTAIQYRGVWYRNQRELRSAITKGIAR